MPTQALTPPDWLSPEHDADPFATYRTLLEEHPVYYQESTGTWLVSRHADILRLLRDADHVTAKNYAAQIEPVHGKTIINLEGKQHSTHRRLLAPFFVRGGLENFIPKIEKVAHELADPWLDRDLEAVRGGEDARCEVDLVEAFIHAYPMTVIEEMLALPKEDHANFSRWYQTMMDFIANLTGEAEPIRKGLEARAELSEYIMPIIAARRRGPANGNDLLTMMCHAEVDGERLSDDEVRAFVSFMLVAGGETSDRAMGNLFLDLLRHPEQLKACYEDRELLPNALAESLRHSPPVHILSRQSDTDVTLHGTTIPAGSVITMVLAAGNRDPRKFKDPDTYDIMRDDVDFTKAYSAAADHLAFANGRHFCAGAMLSRAEILIGANLLLDRMKDMRFADGFAPKESGVYTRGPESLRVSYVPA